MTINESICPFREKIIFKVYMPRPKRFFKSLPLAETLERINTGLIGTTVKNNGPLQTETRCD